MMNFPVIAYIEIEIPLWNILLFYYGLLMALTLPFGIGLSVIERQRRVHANDPEREGTAVFLLVFTIAISLMCAFMWCQMSPWSSN